MTAVLLWKEYRQQRTFWVAIFVVAVLLLFGLAETLGRGSGWQVFRDPAIHAPLNVVVFMLTLAYGVVSGALLLAGENDDGTLVFLDNLTGRRGQLWTRKCLAGAFLTLAQSLALAALAVGLGFAYWPLVFALPLFGLMSLAWGLLAGAICANVLAAVLVGIVMMAVSSLLSVFSTELNMLVLLEAVPAVGAAIVSRLVFCRGDIQRRYARTPSREKQRQWRPGLEKWRAVLWLTLRQGKTYFRVGLVIAFTLGLAVNLQPLVLWPAGSALIGIVCGLAMFAPDQLERNRFLGAQRFPPGLIWTVKMLVWGGAAFVLTAVAWLIPTAALSYLSILLKMSGIYEAYTLNYAAIPEYWVGQWMQGAFSSRSTTDALLLSGIWPLYGFSFAQFFAQLARRPAIAVILSVVVAPVVAALWVPSIIVGGLSAWQVFVVPVILVATTRIAQRSWFAGRLLDAKPLVGVGWAAALMLIAIVVSLWHRATELPDVGEPFDVSAFLSTLPTSNQNEAGPLIRSAVRKLEQHERFVKASFDAIPGDLFPKSDLRLPWARNKKRIPTGKLLDDVLLFGWPKRDKELRAWLGPIFGEHFLFGTAVPMSTSSWLEETHKAVKLPLGTIRDPRTVLESDLSLEANEGFEDIGKLLAVHALHNQVRSLAFPLLPEFAAEVRETERQAVLDDLTTALALSLQVKNYAFGAQLKAGDSIEDSALKSLNLMLFDAQPDAEFLRQILSVLVHHECKVPPPTDGIKAEYIFRSRNQPFTSAKTLAEKIYYGVRLVPWENQREKRKLNASFKEALVVDGSQSNPTVLLAAISRQRIRATQIEIALLLYQADFGKLPTALTKLVPNYLTEVPNDPITGKSFRYAELSQERHPPKEWPSAFIISDADPRFELAVPAWHYHKENHP